MPNWEDELTTERKHVKSSLAVTFCILMMVPVIIVLLVSQSGCAVEASLATWSQHREKTRNRITTEHRFGDGQDDRSREQLREEHAEWMDKNAGTLVGHRD